MAASWRVLTRDLARILRTPNVWVIVIGVLITPALYAWVNIAAFWDPYDNTRNISVAVVNEDEGSSSDLTGSVDVGGQLVSQLRSNDQLGWRFLDADEAEDELKKGETSATITVPPGFSADILSIFEGTFTQPTLKYQVNEKESAISPKITDEGASTLDTTVNSAIKGTVAQAVTTELRNAGGELGDNIDEAGDRTAGAFSEAADTMADAQEEIGRMQERLEDARPTIAATQDALRSADTALGDAGSALDQVQSIMATVQEQVADFSDAATSAYVDGTTALADGVSSANGAVSSVTGELERAGAGLGTASREISGIVRQGDQAIDQLQDLVDGAAVAPGVSGPLNDALSELRERNATNRQLLDDLNELQDSSSGTLDALNAAGDALQDATGETRDSAQGLRSSVSDSLPALNAAINRVSTTAGAFSSSLSAQQTLLQESVGLLDGVDTQLGRAGDVLGEFRGDVDGIEDGLRTARGDVLALVASSGDGILGTVDNLDSVSISQFMASPAEVESHAIYPVPAYGSGMGSLFTNLSMWVGAFMLIVIFRTEVDNGGLRKLTVGQAYRGRLLMLGMFAAIQGLIVAVGDLVIGVQTVNAFAFIASCVLISIAYLTIIYGLVSALGNLGRVIAVVLAFLQIPGASGIYPIQMTPEFFQALHPFLPFTYGIDALRETVGGFYGNDYWKAMGVLAVMALVAFALGGLLRRRMSHVKSMVYREHEKAGLIVSDDVEVFESKYRLADVIRVLSDRDGFREEISDRWKPVREHYPALLRTTIIVGLVGVVVLCLIGRFTGAKTAVFGLLCLWTLLVVATIAGLEYIRQSFNDGQELSELSEAQLRETAAVQSAQTVTVGAPSSEAESPESSESSSPGPSASEDDKA